jgi:Rhomboid-like protein
MSTVVTVPEVPGHVIYYVALVVAASLGWFVLVALARRGHAVGLRAQLDPFVAAIREWIGRAPATGVYVAVITVTSVLQQTAAADNVEAAVSANSTNIRGMIEGPGRVLFGSAFLVADLSVGFLFYVTGFLLVTARLEHRLGSARTIVVAACSHVLATLASVTAIWLGIRAGWLPSDTSVASDVGVSYVLVGTMAGYLMLASRRGRLLLVIVLLAALVAVPAVTGPSVWDLGHAAAAVVGVAAAAIAIRTGPLRPPMLWSALVRRPARRLTPGQRAWGSAVADMQADALADRDPPGREG